MSVSSPPLPAMWRYGIALFVILIGLYGALFALWATGHQDIYEGVLRLFGILPYRVPFLDLDNVFAAIECKARGLDPIIENPCDPLARTLSYPPTWLVIVPGWMGRGATLPAGIVLTIVFLASVAAVLRPASWRGLALSLTAGMSVMTVFEVERANIDSVVFLLCTAVAVLWGGGAVARGVAYAVIFLAGLLKYYPLVLLGLAVRERFAALVAVAAASAAGLVGFWLYFGNAIRESLARVAHGSPFHDRIAASNLPDGLAEFAHWVKPGSEAMVTRAVALPLLAWAATAAWRYARHFGRIDVTLIDTRLLLIGAGLMVGCFFAGQSIGYRGIFLLLTLPALARMPATPAMRRTMHTAIVIILAIMWTECIRQALLAGAAALGLSGNVTAGAFLVFWFSRELMWWWLIGLFAGALLAFARQAPLLRQFGLRRPS